MADLEQQIDELLAQIEILRGQQAELSGAASFADAQRQIVVQLIATANMIQDKSQALIDQLRSIRDPARNISGADQPKNPQQAKNTFDSNAGRIQRILEAVAPSAVEAPSTPAPAGTPPIPSGGAGPPTTNIAAGGPGAEKDELGLDEFFKQVTGSVIDAQSALNENSLEYIANLPPGVPAAYFAIPSVKAEIKAGFRKIEGKGLNLFVFSSNKQRQEYGESTVNFEVVAAPPPPGPTPPAAALVPLPGLLVVGGDKNKLLDRVRATPNFPDELKNDFADAKGRRLAVVLCSREPAKGIKRYLILWPETAEAQDDAPIPWDRVTVFQAVEENGSLTLDTSLFGDVEGDAAADVFLRILSTGQIRGNTKAQLDQTIVSLGNVIMNVALVIDRWMQAVSGSPIHKE